MSRIEEALRKAQTLEDRQQRLDLGPNLEPVAGSEPIRNDISSSLYENIRSEIERISHPLLGVCSLKPGEGSSRLTAALSRRFARERRTLAIDCNFGSPKLHDLLGTGEGAGLGEILFGEKLPNRCILPVPGTRRLFLLPAGRCGVDALSFLGTSYSEKVFEELRNEFDSIVFDSPADEGFGGTLGLCRQADGVLWVVRSGNRNRTALEETLTLYQNAGVNILGAVVNDERDESTKVDLATPSARLRSRRGPR